MTQRLACTAPACNRTLQGVAIWYIVIALLLAVFIPGRSYAQAEPEYDEVSVFFNVPRIGGADIPAVIRNEVLYLPVTDVFDFLKIKNTYSPGFDSIYGFFISQQASYLVDRLHSRIVYQGKVTDIKPGDMIRTETNLYLKASYFGEVFGLQCTFSFRSLSVTLNTKIELPIIREMRQEQMRKNISQLKGDIKADTTIGRKYPLFHFGMADWSAISSQQVQGRVDSRLTLTLGGILAGGETNVTLNYNNNTPFTEKQQFYLWRYANNDHQALRQVMAGKIASGATASLYSPVVGVQFTNTPTTYRRSFGSYTLTDRTEPGWLVELYVNNVLVDFVKADAAGFYTFNVPLVYGNSGVKLQFYGPWGEEHSREQNISIPFNFLPVGDFEYKVSAGMVEDGKSSRFSRAAFNYGVSRRLTLGGGLEYLSSVTSGNAMPFANASLRLASSLLVSSEYTYGVRSKSILSYRLPSNVQFELNYSRYDKGQTAINNNYLEERKFAVSVPIRTKNFAAFSRLTLNQIILPQTKYTTAELLLSGSLLGVNTNFTTYSLLSDLLNPYTYSNLALSFKLPYAIILTPQAQFEYNRAEFVSFKCGMEKHLFKQGFLNLSYEKNMSSNFSNIELGFRYDFSFAQAGFSARRSNKISTLVQSASGSITVDAKTNHIGTSSRASVGKGGITLYPYLDLNCNGRHEPNEPKAFGLNLHVNGGRVEFNNKDTTIRVFDLEPYTNYLVTLDGTNFDNIAWQMRNKTISVAIDPNMFKLVEVPIAVVGEATGTVYLAGSGGKKGQGRIIVNFFSSDSILVARTLSETDGYFSYLGLAPGKYEARIDAAQLKKLNMTSSPAYLHFSIAAGKDGDVVDGLDMVLHPIQQNILPPSLEQGSQPIPDPQLRKIFQDNRDTIGFAPALFHMQSLLIPNPVKVRNYLSQLGTDAPGLTIWKDMGDKWLYSYSNKAFNGIMGNLKSFKILNKNKWLGEGMFSFSSKKSETSPVTKNIVLPEEKKTDVPVIAAIPENAEFNKDTVSSMAYKPYKVQLLALRSPIKVKDYFKQLLEEEPGLTITETLEKDGLYHYSTGSFSDVDESLELLSAVRNNGWKDSFVTHVQEKNAVVEQKNNLPAKLPVVKFIVIKDTASIAPGDTLYKVQLLTLHVPIRVKGYFDRLLADMPGLMIEETEGEGGVFHYSTGAFRDIAQARQCQKIIIKGGWEDCFITTFTGEARDAVIFRFSRIETMP